MSLFRSNCTLNDFVLLYTYTQCIFLYVTGVPPPAPQQVPRSLYVGDSVLVFVAEGTEGNAGVAALAQALFELNTVALVRRVYNRVAAPRLGVLVPE